MLPPLYSILVFFSFLVDYLLGMKISTLWTKKIITRGSSPRWRKQYIGMTGDDVKH